MIDKIIEATRVKFPIEPNEILYFYFDDLLSFSIKEYELKEKPTLELVYTLTKDCQVYDLDKKYIIYDQYLGQVFNKLNRLIYCENQLETTSYLCKLLGEEYYQINDLKNTINYLVFYQSNSKANLQDLPKEFLIKKYELISVQESFVLIHELGHILIEDNPNLVDDTSKFIKNDSSSNLIFETTIKSFLPNDNQNSINHFLEELTCDFISLDIIHNYFIEKKYSPESIFEGVTLAFLYLRTLEDLKHIAKRTFLKSNNVYHLFCKLRYNLMRHYIAEKYKNADLMKIVEIYEIWEEKIDKDVVCYLDDELKSKLNNLLSDNFKNYNEDLAKTLLKLTTHNNVSYEKH